jgi:hypothetical protein
VNIPTGYSKTREPLSQYIDKSLRSLKKISIMENREATVISHAYDSEFFKGIEGILQLVLDSAVPNLTTSMIIDL